MFKMFNSKRKFILEKMREVEWRNFDTEEQARKYAAYVMNIFANDFKDLKMNVNVDIEKSEAIVLGGKDIGKWVDNYSVKFYTREA